MMDKQLTGQKDGSVNEPMLCMPLYVLTKEYIKLYKDALKKINLTFTQYIVMVVLWKQKEMKVKEIGRCLFLDSGTLTPVLKKLEAKGFVLRSRSDQDARDLCISLTESGEKLLEDAQLVRENLMEEFGTKKRKSERIQELLTELIGLLSEEYEERVGKEFRVL